MNEFKGTPGPWVADKTSRAVGPISRDDDQSYGILIPVAWVEFDTEVEIQASNQNLIAAAPELLKSLTDGATVDLPELLDWVADRMVHVYGENENIDFVLTLRHRASVCRAAIAKALGETK